MVSLPRRLFGEFLGTLLLVTVVVGSGIAAQQLSPSDTGLQLLENALATALGLAVLIAVFQPLSGAHFNPVISLVDAALGGMRRTDAAAYIPAQIGGAVAGSMLANLMFGLPAIEFATTERLTPATALGELVATAGLALVVFVLVRTGRAGWAGPAVGAYIFAAYFFTSSTSFANPAVTIGRIFTDTFAGIQYVSALGFVAAQLVGALIGLALAVVATPAAPIAHQSPQSIV